MRNGALHDALRDFVLEASALLEGELDAGAEVPFELAEEPGGGAVLYRYRPLTREFIAERWPALRELPGCKTAAVQLGSGAAAYLRVRGLPGADAEPALQALLERLYEEASRFDFPEERFERVYAEVERTLFEGTFRATLVAALLGARIEAERVDLGDGATLVRGETMDAPPEAVWPPAAEGSQGAAEPHVLCVLQRDVPSDMPLPIAEARARFREVVTGLRLFKSGGVAFGPLAWARADGGPWQPVPLAATGHARGHQWALPRGEEAELRELLGLLGRSRHGGPLAWALARFEMGCERALDTEALSDYLLALRALLDAGDDAGRASLSLRLAALCAEEGHRRAVQRGVELAFALERFVIGGGTGEAYIEKIGSDSPRTLVLEIEEHVRALLRDVLCGYLDQDLKSAADDILLASGEPLEIGARDLRGRGRARAGVAVEAEGESEAMGAGPAAAGDLGAAGHPAGAAAGPPGTTAAEVGVGPEDAVTPSADWGFDDDEDDASYSAPV